MNKENNTSKSKGAVSDSVSENLKLVKDAGASAMQMIIRDADENPIAMAVFIVGTDSCNDVIEMLDEAGF